jgi:hypothetical protein
VRLFLLALCLATAGAGCTFDERRTDDPTFGPAAAGPLDAAEDADGQDAFVCCDPSCAATMPLGCNECFCSGGHWVCSTFGCEDASFPRAPAEAASDAPAVGDGSSDAGAE